MAKLKVSDIHVDYGRTQILKGVSVDVAEGEIVALLGRSGCGKSTLLRAIAGLEAPTRGSIVIGDRTVFDATQNINLAPERRDLGLVFQSYALWPHKTVLENVAYGLKVRNRPPAEIKEMAAEVLTGVGLADYAARYPSELSGGQQQRVALARALAYRPPLILLDEPLSNLDAKLREEARVWIRQLIKKAKLTAIFVTHDQVEAMAIADRIMLLNEGRLVQEGGPEELYTQPNSYFSADFMGVNNTFEATITEVRNGHARLDLGDGELWGVNRASRAAGERATAVIRMESVRVGEGGHLRAPLDASAYLGGRWEHVFDLQGRPLRATTEGRLQPGTYPLHLPKEALWLF